MSHQASARFWRHFEKLTPELQQLARASYELLRADSHHPSLHFKRVNKYWSDVLGPGIVRWESTHLKAFFGFGLGPMKNIERLIG